jgi:hypothetical protein
MSVVGGVEYHQIRNANSWTTFNRLGNSNVTAVAAAPDADGTAQFVGLSAGTEDWIMRNADGTWTAITPVNTGTAQTALAGFNTAKTSNTWYGTTQLITGN